MEMAMDFYLLSTHNICCRPLPFFNFWSQSSGLDQQKMLRENMQKL